MTVIKLRLYLVRWCILAALPIILSHHSKSVRRKSTTSNVNLYMVTLKVCCPQEVSLCLRSHAYLKHNTRELTAHTDAARTWPGVVSLGGLPVVGPATIASPQRCRSAWHRAAAVLLRYDSHTVCSDVKSLAPTFGPSGHFHASAHFLEVLPLTVKE